MYSYLGVMRVLTEYIAELFLEKEGFPIVEKTLCKTEAEALKVSRRYSFPVVLKVVSGELIHKSEKHAVRINVGEENFHQIFKELENVKVKKEGILVQRFVEGTSLLVGLKKDPTFGHVLAVGLGGVYTELIKDISLRIVPVTKKDVKEMLEELKCYKVLQGYRGEKINFEKLEEIMLKLSKLAERYSNLEELDINPLIINEKEAKVVDARIVFG